MQPSRFTLSPPVSAIKQAAVLHLNDLDHDATRHGFMDHLVLQQMLSTQGVNHRCTTSNICKDILAQQPLLGLDFTQDDDHTGDSQPTNLHLTFTPLPAKRWDVGQRELSVCTGQEKAAALLADASATRSHKPF
ncbi:unnamed protein product [Bubo scandiacus]